MGRRLGRTPRNIGRELTSSFGHGPQMLVCGPCAFMSARDNTEYSLRQAVVEVTNRCNLRCPHCASASGRARADEMSLGELRHVMRDLSELGCKIVTLLGGECLLRPDWYAIASSVKPLGMKLQLVTNGLLVTETVREQFKALNPNAIGVSLDGATSDSYRRARGVDQRKRGRRITGIPPTCLEGCKRGREMEEEKRT